MKIAVCNICGNNLLDRLDDMKSTAYAPGRSFGLSRCEKCQLVFLNPQHGPEGLRAFYPEDYGPHDPGNISGNNPRKTLMDAFREHVFSSHTTPRQGSKMLTSFLARCTTHLPIDLFRPSLRMVRYWMWGPGLGPIYVFCELWAGVFKELRLITMQHSMRRGISAWM